MKDVRWAWDPRKALANQQKHGVSFELATRVFDDPCHLSIEDPYFHDLGRTVPFRIDRNARARTITQLSRALDNYARKTGRRVNIAFSRMEAVDGRLKRIVIHDAQHLTKEDV